MHDHKAGAVVILSMARLAYARVRQMSALCVRRSSSPPFHFCYPAASSGDSLCSRQSNTLLSILSDIDPGTLLFCL